MGVPGLRPQGACSDPPAGLGVLPPRRGGDLHWSAPANPSLLAWQREDKAGQKYLCGWRKVNSSASLFFPGNRGHRQIQQNRSRESEARPLWGVRGSPAPHAHCCLLPSGSVMVWVAVVVAGGGEWASKGLESRHPATPGLDGPCGLVGLNPPIVPLGKRTQGHTRHLPKVARPVRSCGNSTGS